MPRLEREPTFLPLTINATYVVARATADEPALRASADARAAPRPRGRRRRGRVLGRAVRRLRRARQARPAEPPARADRGDADYAGTRWWFGRGSQHRERVTAELARIEEAVDERDGADFAEAFVGYDQAVAAALVNSHSRLETPAQ